MLDRFHQDFHCSFQSLDFLIGGVLCGELDVRLWQEGLHDPLSHVPECSHGPPDRT